MSDTSPTWDDDINALFAAPFWVDDPAAIAASWRGCMGPFLIDLADYDSVKEWSVTVYNHLASRDMPMVTEAQSAQYWPDEALELLATWINDGWRRSASDPFDRAKRIPSDTGDHPVTPHGLMVRKDITSLSQLELDTYRAAVDALGAGSTDPDRHWARLANIHTNWCLHYQEAFLLWHRAYLMHFEQQLGCAVPFWNWMSPDVAVDGSARAGLPQAFIDTTYVHPETGEERPNPLRFAVARDGQSKACVEQGHAPPVDGCEYVARDPILYTVGDDQREARQRKLDYLVSSQREVLNALEWPRFSSPEIETAGSIPYPWANIPQFPARDSEYPHKADFDGLYEQPHDNFHGWVGPDMGDNSYTAYDPVFWSLHSNIDRVFEQWRAAHPTAEFTAEFPLRPFVGPRAETLNLDDPDGSTLTTIGDMFAPASKLGFVYGPSDDVTLPESGDEQPGHLYVLFPGVRCTHDSYLIDVFLDLDAPTSDDAWATNPHYVGRMSRIGMGIDDVNGRCIAHSITRVMDATVNASMLGLAPDADVTITQLVTDLTTNKQLTRAEWEALPGFVPHAVWGRPRSVVHTVLSADAGTALD